MNRDKQIEEMELTDVDILANDINKHCIDLSQTYCGGTSCTSCLAHALTEKGYRKSTDVAREIAEEILEMAECYGGGVLFWQRMKRFASDLKKERYGE